MTVVLNRKVEKKSSKLGRMSQDLNESRVKKVHFGQP